MFSISDCSLIHSWQVKWKVIPRLNISNKLTSFLPKKIFIIEYVGVGRGERKRERGIYLNSEKEEININWKRVNKLPEAPVR